MELARYLVLSFLTISVTNAGLYTRILRGPDSVIEGPNHQQFCYQGISLSVGKVFATTQLHIKSVNGRKFTLHTVTRTQNSSKSTWLYLTTLAELLKSDGSNEITMKISPFKDFCFYLNPISIGNIQISVKLTSVDNHSICWFLIGCILFCAAKTLSRSATFHYTSGVSIGVLMSWMIVLIILYKLLPYKRLMSYLVVTSTGFGVYFTQTLLDQFSYYAIQYPYHLVGWCSFFAVLSLSIIYYFGPPSNERGLNLIQWFLQISALYMIYRSSFCKEFSITAICCVISLQFFNLYSLTVKLIILVTPRRLYYWYNRPPVRHLLTQEEYEKQGIVETRHALEELQKYCGSPDCSTWKVVSVLKDPKRFATFLNSGEAFTTDELNGYDMVEEDVLEDSIDESPNHQPNCQPTASPDEQPSISRVPNEWLTDDDSANHSLILTD